LAQLEPPDLKSIFGGAYASVNQDLETYLQDRYKQYSGGGPAKPFVLNGRAMPCSLQGTNRNIGIAAPPSAATNALTRQLASAEFVLRTEPDRQAAAIASIENALDAVQSYHPESDDWSPAYYADLGVKFSLRLSDPGRAKVLLLRGLQLEPDSDQLHYLSRILMREKILQPTDIAQSELMQKYR
jgi:hypothetical protein